MNAVHTADRLDLNLLRVFEAVFRERHLSRAAESLFVTPSAVSHALGRLRLYFGDPLFVRVGKDMRPTALCHRIAPALVEEMARLRHLLHTVGRFDPAHSRHTFSLGLPDAVEAGLLPALTRRMRTQAPFARLESIHIDRGDVARTLARNALCVAVDVVLPLQPPVRHRPIFTDRFCLIAPLEAQPRIETIGHYLAAEHVAVSSRAAGTVVEDLALQSLGHARSIAVRCQDYHSAARVVEGSGLLLTAPMRLADAIVRGLSVGVQPLPVELPPVELHLYWHANAELDPANAWFRDLVSTSLEPAAAPGRSTAAIDSRSALQT